VPIPIWVRRNGYRIAYALLLIWRIVVRPPTRGVKCLLVDGGRVLLVRHTYGSGKWDLPGGSIRRNEAPLHAARRETREELGIAVDDWADIGTLHARVRRRADTVHVFRAEVASPELILARAELADARWFPRDRLPTPLSRYARALIRSLWGGAAAGLPDDRPQ
jgi:8-oxo-dGTP pyrophosphatase MutT (NUDIX family)